MASKSCIEISLILGLVLVCTNAEDNVFNVLSYGAKADGVTDDSKIITELSEKKNQKNKCVMDHLRSYCLLKILCKVRLYESVVTEVTSPLQTKFFLYEGLKALRVAHLCFISRSFETASAGLHRKCGKSFHCPQTPTRVLPWCMSKSEAKLHKSNIGNSVVLIRLFFLFLLLNLRNPSSYVNSMEKYGIATRRIVVIYVKVIGGVCFRIEQVRLGKVLGAPAGLPLRGWSADAKKKCDD
ncbi:hypothetical protein RND71_019290 [Anisodus tanguticus]|uniref:Uncharacterized protein n=1 Tax=Anisodus tanguticus TaxID=243964 RepID=A0AAE1V8C5_9SOLA|nr:hypothetical protein RND71_019290 [Anisodus tanguticus]